VTYSPVKVLQDALRKALDHGVEVLEFPQQDRSINKTSHNTINSLGLEIARRCHMYEWPMAQQPFTTYRDSSGRVRTTYVTLHAKIAVADDKLLFVSSANLTQHAMLHNVEMGVLFRTGGEPGQVKRHFQALVENGSFVKKSEDDIVVAALN
jgi:phosphatidylserine/phosphatidylglycerophosphate/cardiolipin synthase-like enzyme